MEYDREKADELVLALLQLTAFEDRGVRRAWKGIDWGIMNRLHEKGFISNPRNKAKSVVFSNEGFQLSRELYKKHFGTENNESAGGA
jgi:hypothetical protein